MKLTMGLFESTGRNNHFTSSMMVLSTAEACLEAISFFRIEACIRRCSSCSLSLSLRTCHINSH